MKNPYFKVFGFLGTFIYKAKGRKGTIDSIHGKISIKHLSGNNLFSLWVSGLYVVAGLLVVVGGVVVQVMRQIEFGVKLYLLLHVAETCSD